MRWSNGWARGCLRLWPANACRGAARHGTVTDRTTVSDAEAQVEQTRAGHGPAPRASIVDVAQRAGVSVATVSRALRDMPNVSAATRDRVLRAAAELEYTASPL